LPRQARDKHRKSRKKKLFPAGTLKSYWRFTSDDPSRTRLLFTLLKLGLSGVKFSPDKDDSNITHVEGIGSPEYPGPVGTVDTNFGLAISRWGIRTLLEIAVQEPELQHDPAVAKYSHVLSTLVPFSADSTGYMLDPQHRFLLPHRHWSHIILIYDLELKEGRFNHTAGACISHLVSQPAYSSLKNPENGPEYAIQEQRTKLNGCVVSCTLTCNVGADNSLLTTSLDHWSGLTCNDSMLGGDPSRPGTSCPNSCRGFSRGATAVMSALTSRPEAAQGNLTKLLDTVITPNGMYGEGVTNNAPVRERHSSAILY
jgi:hypothetical protein